ncbi:hypothetical protein [Bradyrhizobium sp. RT9a]|uniref:DUF6963 family protein n=1 Tax=Bradyrhizobium sp. RT9a TaxID=3156384 RepID=UPI003392CA6D
MTIAIGAFGPNAGLAVFRALRASEKVATGAIGGFATFAAITDDGRPIFSVTQRGGAATAFIQGETTGVEPWPEFAGAKVAAVISSGPDRRGDLTKFIPIDPLVGLVTGHRSPSTVGCRGKAMNADALARMQTGIMAADVARAVVSENPEADCGLVCVDIAGHIGVANTERVLRRPDVATVLRRDDETGAAVGVLHNAIRPRGAVAELAASIAIETMTSGFASSGFVTIGARTPILAGQEDAVFCDTSGKVLRVMTANPSLGTAGSRIEGVYLASAVWLGDRLVGRTTFEPIATIEDGHLVLFDGKDELQISYR